MSNAIPSNSSKGSGSNLSAILYGNFRDLYVGMWGTLEILVDPYTDFAKGTTGVRAIQSIDRGQFEACKALGFKKYIYFFKVIIPQMLRLAIPNLSNVWQITLKDTSLISVTGLVEIMRQSYIAAGSTRDPLFFYCFAAILYLMLTYISMKIINRLEIKYSRGY